tara:strand:+ start:5 stop:1921 length:1917 start_codon:yes stop_codon:yes gene_type:complete
MGTKIVDLRRAVGSGAGGGGAAYGPEAFVTEWTVGAGDTIKLWHYDGGISGFTMDYDVDWGDGSSNSNVTTVDETHTYADAGTYQVVITNQFGALNMFRASATEKGYLTKMVQWGTDNIWSALYRMFYQCTNMLYEATDYPNLTNLVENKDARQMFRECSSITALDLSNWTNTSNFTNLSQAFQKLNACASLNLSGLDFSDVTNFDNGFREIGTAVGGGCAINLSNITWGSVTNFSFMFYLTDASSLDLSGWDFTGNPDVDLYAFMYDFEFVGEIDLSTWINFSSWRTLYAFRNINATGMNITGWDTSNATSYYGMFYQAAELERIIGLNELSSASVTGNAIQAMFQDCKMLSFTGTANNFSSAWGLGLGNCTNISYMFYRVGSNLGSGGSPPYVDNWVLNSNTSITHMFYFTKFSSAPAIQSWDTSSLAGTQTSFIYASNWGTPYTLDLSAWNFTNAVTNWSSTFRQAANLTSVEFDSANCDFGGTTTINSMFYNSDQLETIRFKGPTDFSAITDIQTFTYDNDALTTLDMGTVQDFSAVTNWNNFTGYNDSALIAPMDFNFLSTANISATSLNLLLPVTRIQTSQYDNLLIALNTVGNINGTLQGGNSTYTAAGAGGTARAALVTAGWTITDGGGV